jgi:hypothetical protein
VNYHYWQEADSKKKLQGLVPKGFADAESVAFFRGI